MRLTRGNSHLSLWLTLMGCAGDSRFDALFEGTNGYSTLLPHRGLPLVLTRAGSRLTFIAEISRDTFAVATLVDRELMRGSTGPKFYGGGELSARR